MLRVAVLGNYVASTDQRTLVGGVQSASSYLIDALREFKDLDLHVVTCDQPTPYESSERLEGLTLHRLPGSTRGQVISRYRHVRRRIHRVLSRIQPDVVHAQDLDKYALSLVGLAGPRVVTVHGIAREEARFLESRRDRLRTLLRARWISEPSLRSAPDLIAISPYVRRYFPLLAHHRVHDIPNAIDERFFALDHPGCPDRVLYAGRVIPRKRVRELVGIIDAVRRHRSGVELRIAGDLSDVGYARSLQEFIRARGLDQQVTFLGQLDEAAVLDEYQRCSVLALCSAQETAPMVIAQAMAAAKPVVATAVGGVPDMVEHGVTGYVAKTDDFGALAHYLTTVLAEPHRARLLGMAARSKAEQEYRASVVAARTRDVYFAIAGAQPESGGVSTIRSGEPVERFGRGALRR